MIKQRLKKYIPKSLVYHIRGVRDLIRWNFIGRPIPPPYYYKRTQIQKYARKFNLQNFVETGTWHGETVYHLINSFDKIISIEIGEDHYQNAKKRFVSYKHIQILKGDSGVLLPSIVKNIDKPVIYWLDGHYMQGMREKVELNTPIIRELSCIFDKKLKGNVILIDDARDFTGSYDYPTIDILRKFVLSVDQNVDFEVYSDIIRITPKLPK